MDLKCQKLIECQQGAIRAVRFNVDGAYCMTGGSDKKIKLWNPKRSLLLKTYGGHGNEVLDVCGSCDNSQLASCGADKTVILWDVTTGQPLRRLREHVGKVTCVRFNEDSSVIVSASQDNSVLCWDAKSRKNEPIQRIQDAKDGITSLAVTDHEIITGSLDCKVRRYDIRMGQLTSDFIGESITSMCLTHDGQCYIVSCQDNTVRLMDKDTGELLSEYKGHKCEDYFIDCSVNSNDSYIISGSTDGCIYIWELVSGEVTKLPTTGKGKVIHSLSPHPSNNSLLSASGNNIELWDTNSSSDEMENDD